VGIVLDGRQRANEFARGHSLFEYSVQASAALSDALLAQGNRVGLLVYARILRWTIPGYGKVQRERILYSLAHARPGGSEVFADLANSRHACSRSSRRSSWSRRCWRMT
jgi:uncharacterized protein (DUF58 family)